MHPRLRLDLGWRDLLFAAAACVLARGRERRARRVEECFDARGDAMATLSVRSAFDLYLSVLNLPHGSEVLVSGLTIPHMVQIVEAHGLRVVPFALDARTLAPAAGELERCATSRTRAVLFAHLFGERTSLQDLMAEARRRHWLVWEDCAQAFAHDDWRGERGADLALFSFGMIKTATAIQGGIALVRDEGVRDRMRVLQERWPVQARSDFLRRTCKAAVLHCLSHPRVFAQFAALVQRRGRDLDEVLHAATRGFPGPDYLERLRRAPCAPMLALLERRLRRPHRSNVAARCKTGDELMESIESNVEVFGRAATDRKHWVFAVGSSEPAHLVRDLRAAGFDATTRSSLVAVVPTDGGDAPPAIREMLERVVFVPIAPNATRAERARSIDVLCTHGRRFRARGPCPIGVRVAGP
jgi:dTDP-4-amino-4,6-dideoxygalactose transaminase